MIDPNTGTPVSIVTQNPETPDGDKFEVQTVTLQEANAQIESNMTGLPPAVSKDYVLQNFLGDQCSSTDDCSVQATISDMEPDLSFHL